MITLRSSMQWAGAVSGLGLVVVGVVGLAGGGGPLDVGIVALGVATVAFWLRPAIVIGPDEVLVRPLVASRRIARRDVVAADALPIQGWPRWQQLVLRLADGDLVVVHRLAQRGDGGAVDQARELLGG